MIVDWICKNCGQCHDYSRTQPGKKTCNYCGWVRPTKESMATLEKLRQMPILTHWPEPKSDAKDIRVGGLLCAQCMKKNCAECTGIQCNCKHCKDCKHEKTDE